MTTYYPEKIHANDIGEFYTDADDASDETLLLCCTTSDGAIVEAGSPQLELMEEMARRFNTHGKLVAALESCVASKRLTVDLLEKCIEALVDAESVSSTPSRKE